MNLLRRQLCTAGIAFSLSNSWGQSWPVKPVRMVVPFPPGGSTDLAARLLSEPLTRALGQPVVIENRPGANGNLGTAEVARSQADGHTLLMAASGTLVINPYVYAKSSFDITRDFSPVSLIMSSPLVVVVHPSMGIKSLPDLIAFAKARSDPMSYGSPAIASTSHLAAELFADRAGIKLNHVPYKGSAPMIQDVLGGHLPMAFDTLASALPHVQAGRLQALAVTSSAPVAALPGVPTLATMLPKFEAEGWIALLAPAGTPASVVNRLASEVATIIRQPTVTERIRSAGAEPLGSGPATLQPFLAREAEKWKEVVARTGVKLD